MSTTMIIWIVVASLLIITLGIRIAGEHRGHHIRMDRDITRKSKIKP